MIPAVEFSHEEGRQLGIAVFIRTGRVRDQSHAIVVKAKVAYFVTENETKFPVIRSLKHAAGEKQDVRRLIEE